MNRMMRLQYDTTKTPHQQMPTLSLIPVLKHINLDSKYCDVLHYIKTTFNHKVFFSRLFLFFHFIKKRFRSSWSSSNRLIPLKHLMHDSFSIWKLFIIMHSLNDQSTGDWRTLSEFVSFHFVELKWANENKICCFF